MSYHGSNVRAARHYLGGDAVPPVLVARVLGSNDGCCPPGAVPCAPCGPPRGYLAGLGTDEKKASLARARMQAKVSGDVAKAKSKTTAFAKPTQVEVKKGKVVVPTSSLWSEWNKSAAKIMVPFIGAIAASPLPNSVKADLKNRPLDAVMNIFDPIEDAVGRAVDRVLAKKGNVQNYFGTNKNLKRVQAVDLKADASTQNLLRRARTIDAFFVLFFTQPIELAAEMMNEGINIVGDAAAIVADVAQNIANAAGQAAAAVIKAGSDAASEVASWFGLGSLGGLGDGGVVSAPAAGAAATGVAATAGAAAEAGLASVIATIISVLSAAAATAASDGIKNLIDPKTNKPVEKATTTSAPTVFVPTFQPTSGPTLGGGVSPVLIFGGAAVAAFFILSKKPGKRK